jgi:hypothetical protein
MKRKSLLRFHEEKKKQQGTARSITSEHYQPANLSRAKDQR